MAINPIAFARTVNEQFLRYQLTAFPIADESLARQAEESIRGVGARPTPLIKGPYLSLAKAFQMGPRVQDLVTQGVNRGRRFYAFSQTSLGKRGSPDGEQLHTNASM